MLFKFFFPSSVHSGGMYYLLNNYIVRSYRDAIVVINTAASRTNKT